jgi:hypothetical protein
MVRVIDLENRPKNSSSRTKQGLNSHAWQSLYLPQPSKMFQVCIGIFNILVVQTLITDDRDPCVHMIVYV